MKKASIYFFLFVYGTVMLKPAMPYVKDFTAHLLFYKDHMLTVHAHNGKYHVHAEIAVTEKEGAQDKNSNNSKKDAPGGEHLMFAAYTIPCGVLSVDWSTKLFIAFSNIFKDPPFPPPRFSQFYCV